MKRIDINSYLGDWPFKKLCDLGIENYKQIAKKHNIEKTYVSYFQSIFYEDFLEGEKELHNLIKSEENLLHVMTLNPSLPCYLDIYKNYQDEFDVKAIKIFPNYHDFDLEKIDDLLKLPIPLFINLRNMDIRSTYLLNEKPVDLEKLKKVLKKANKPVVLLQPFINELDKIKNYLNENIYIDTCGLRHATFPLEKALEFISSSNILYGTSFPHNCIQNSNMIVETAEVSDKIKSDIFYNNVNKII